MNVIHLIDRKCKLSYDFYLAKWTFFTPQFGMINWVELKQMMSSTQFSGCKSECAVIRI